MDILREIRIRNEDNQDKMGEASVENKIQGVRLRWFEHMMSCMDTQYRGLRGWLWMVS